MLGAALLLTATMVGGQPSESIDQNLKQLEFLVGSWNVSFDSPDIPVKEAKVTYRWAMDGKYLEARWSKVDGTDLGPEIFAWDPVHKKIRMWGFDPDSFYEATWHVEGKKWIGKYSGIKFAGKKTRDTVTIDFSDTSVLLLTSTPDGAEKPNGTGKFIRVKTDK